MAGRIITAVALLAATVWMLTAGAVQASPTDVVKVVFERSGSGWRVSVTLRHADSGWKHYANLWVVETLGGKELGRRVLYHPHENEQPFTRSQTVKIPAGISKVRIRAGDNLAKGVQGQSNTVIVNLAKASGNRFEVR